jgi:sulfatase maturation enzyme AslB (radical SAM superfamily)
MWRESNSKDRWDRIERSVRMFEKSGVWDFDERIMQIQLKSFGIECNLDCHMCNHDSSSMRIDMMNKHNVYSEKMFGPMEKTQRKIKLVEDNLNKIDKKSVVEQIKELAPYLNSIKIIGGEPLIMKKYFDFLNEILKTGHAEHITVKFQTNLTKLGEGDHKFLKFVPHFKQTSFTASIDGVGKYAEYLRRRSIWSEIEDNIDLLASDKYKGKAFVDVNSVITCFSVLRFDEVIKFCSENPGIRSAGWLMIERPKSLRVNNLPKKLKDKLIPKYKGWPDIQAALRMPEEPDNDFQDTLNYMLQQDKAYKGTKWESHLFDVFPELKEYHDERRI